MKRFFKSDAVKITVASALLFGAAANLVAGNWIVAVVMASAVYCIEPSSN
jgi:hypothetical protein